MRKLRVLLLILVPLLSYAFLEPYWIQEKTTVISSTDLPPSFRGMRIVFISDIHHSPLFSQARLRSIVRRVNGLDPDLIILGGDYVTADPAYIAPCFQELGELKATYGVFAVLGNHDNWVSSSMSVAAMAKAGLYNINNKGYWIRQGSDRLRICGVGDYYTDSQQIGSALGDAKENDFVVLVSHTPDYVEEVMHNRHIDLMLSGHTHGGQVTLFGLYAPVIPTYTGQKYRSGVYNLADFTLIVSNGIGMYKLPIRFFARPQINIIMLQSKE